MVGNALPTHLHQRRGDLDVCTPVLPCRRRPADIEQRGFGTPLDGLRHRTDPWGPTSIRADSVPSIMPRGKEVAVEVMGESLPMWRLPSSLP
jgi:hypothetical protein